MTEDSPAERPAIWYPLGAPDSDADSDVVSVHGTLAFGADGRPQPTWHERMPTVDGAGGVRGFWPVLRGEVMGTAVTLLGASTVTGRQPMRGSVSQTTGRASVALEGPFWPDEDELTFDRATFRVDHLDAWANWASWADNMDDAGFYDFSVTRQGRQEHQFRVGQHRLLIVDDATWDHDGYSFTLTRGCRFELELAQPLSLDDLDYQWLRPLQMLVTTGSAQPSGLHALIVSNTYWTVEEPDRWLTVRAGRQRPVPAPDGGLDFRHHLRDFEDVTMTGHLAASVTHRFALERYDDVRSERATGRLSAMVGAIQALESLDDSLHSDTPAPWQSDVVAHVDAALQSAGIPGKARGTVRRAIRSAHRTSLSTRLLRSDQTTGLLITGLAGDKLWAQHLQGIRNAAVHGRGGAVFRDAADVANVARDIALFLFEVNWLSTCGFTPERATELVTSRVHHWSFQERVRRAAPHLADLAKAATPPNE